MARSTNDSSDLYVFRGVTVPLSCSTQHIVRSQGDVQAKEFANCRKGWFASIQKIAIFDEQGALAEKKTVLRKSINSVRVVGCSSRLRPLPSHQAFQCAARLAYQYDALVNAIRRKYLVAYLDVV